MAIYRVQAPDGSILRIEGPDNARPEEIEAFAAQQFKSKQQQEPEKSQPIDPGFGQAALIGTGRQLDRLGKGVKQMGLNVASAFGSDGAQGKLEEMAVQEKENSRLYEGLQKVRPGATMLGEAAPLVAAPILGAGYAGAAASAALPGLMEYGTGEERLARGAMGTVGGVAGRGLGNLLARGVKPTAALSESQQAANAAADRLGVKMTGGEASGNRALKFAESVSADMPIASGVASKRMAANDRAIAQAATRGLGQQADEVSERVLREAHDRISDQFGKILSPLKIDLASKDVKARLNQVVGSDVLTALRNEDVSKILVEIADKGSKGPVTGQWFQQNKTALDAAIRGAYNSGRPGEAKALEGIEEALDFAAKKAMGGKTAQAYEGARKQWANLRMLETGKVVEEGRVLPGRLKSAMESRYKGAAKEGRLSGELPDIAKLAGSLRQPPQSGTAPRSLYTGMLGGAAMIEPTTAASMVALPTMLQGLAASPAMRKYMTKGLLDLSPEAERRLLLMGTRGGLLGAYGASQ